MIYRFLCTMLAVCILLHGHAQSEVSKDVAQTPEQHIQALNSGVLLVRLKSNRKKIEAIEAQLASATGKNAEKWAKMLEKNVAETEETNSRYVLAFESEYDFSQLAYFYDYDTKAIVDRQSEPWQSDLETPVIITEETPRYILSFGRTPESSISGLIILTPAQYSPDKPFPNNVTVSGFAAIFAGLSGKKEKAHVGRLNKKLVKYFTKVQAKQGE